MSEDSDVEYLNSFLIKKRKKNVDSSDKQNKNQKTINNEDDIDETQNFIKKLPNEILIMIFSYLGMDDLKTSSLVCKHWLNVVFTPALTENFPLTFSDCIFRDDFAPYSIFKETPKFRRFPRIAVGSLTETIHSEFNEPEDIPRALEVLKDISHGTSYLEVLEDAPKDILQSFPYIEHLRVYDNLDMINYENNLPESLLSIYVTNLKNQKDENISKLKNLRTLKCKELDLTPSFPEHNHSDALIPLSVELKTFLAQNESVSKIVNTKLNLLLTKDEQEEGKKLLGFEDVCGIKLEKKITDPKILHNFTNLKRIELCVDECFNFHKQINLIGVRKLKIEPRNKSDFFSPTCCENCFSSIIESCPNVQKLIIKFYVEDDQLKQIIQKYPNLKTLSLNLYEFVNGEILFPPEESQQPGLKSLQNLKELHLIDDGAGSDIFTLAMLLDWPEMPKLESLIIGYINAYDDHNIERVVSRIAYKILAEKCPNVRNALIKATWFSENDYAAISMGWPNLLTLGLVSSSRNCPFGKTFIAENCKRLKYLIIQNYKSYWEEEDVAKWFFKMFKANPSLSMIDLKYQIHHLHYGEFQKWVTKGCRTMLCNEDEIKSKMNQLKCDRRRREANERELEILRYFMEEFDRIPIEICRIRNSDSNSYSNSNRD